MPPDACSRSALEDHRATAYPPIMETAGSPAKDIEFPILPSEERLTADFEARLVALACGEPQAGHAQ